MQNATQGPILHAEGVLRLNAIAPDALTGMLPGLVKAGEIATLEAIATSGVIEAGTALGVRTGTILELAGCGDARADAFVDNWLGRASTSAAAQSPDGDATYFLGEQLVRACRAGRRPAIDRLVQLGADLHRPAEPDHLRGVSRVTPFGILARHQFALAMEILESQGGVLHPVAVGKGYFNDGFRRQYQENPSTPLTGYASGENTWAQRAERPITLFEYLLAIDNEHKSNNLDNWLPERFAAVLGCVNTRDPSVRATLGRDLDLLLCHWDCASERLTADHVVAFTQLVPHADFASDAIARRTDIAFPWQLGVRGSLAHWVAEHSRRPTNSMVEAFVNLHRSGLALDTQLDSADRAVAADTPLSWLVRMVNIEGATALLELGVPVGKKSDRPMKRAKEAVEKNYGNSQRMMALLLAWQSKTALESAARKIMSSTPA